TYCNYVSIFEFQADPENVAAEPGIEPEAVPNEESAENVGENDENPGENQPNEAEPPNPENVGPVDNDAPEANGGI
ncbi:MAG: hypothetical protein AAF449_11930, partial [Myxococcota bacterium]